MNSREKSSFGALGALFVSSLLIGLVLLYVLCYQRAPVYDLSANVDLLTAGQDQKEGLQTTGLLNVTTFLFVTMLMFVAMCAVMYGTWQVAKRYYGLPLVSLKRYIHDIRYKKERAVLPDELEETMGELVELSSMLGGIRDDIVQANHAVKKAEINLDRRVASQTQKLDASMRRLQKQSDTDALTQVANRGCLDTMLPQYVMQAYNTKTDLVCMMVDMDHFKMVNDVLGHQTGDDLIVVCAQILKGCLRDQDFIARYGGDEFIILLPGVSQDKGVEVAKRLCALFVQGVKQYVVDGVSPSLSIGLGGLPLNYEVDGIGLLKLADNALYRAKAAGRNGASV